MDVFPERSHVQAQLSAAAPALNIPAAERVEGAEVCEEGRRYWGRLFGLHRWVKLKILPS